MPIDEQWADSGLIGKLVASKYLVVRELHESPRSAIHEAEHVELGRRVAIKIMRSHPATDTLRAHLRDRKTLASFGHRHIVDITDVGTLDNGDVFVASELVRGVPLRTLVGDRAMVQRRALSIARQMLEAVRAAHEVGVVHRDLNPDHILVAPGERDTDHVFVLGYGLARLEVAAASVQPDPGYLAPERVLGKRGDIRADLYSVAAMLFELLTGHPVFHAKGEQALMRLHAYAPVQTLKQRASDRSFTSETEELVARALDKQPEKRFQTADEMIAALDVALTSVEAVEAAATVASRPAPRSKSDSLALLARDLIAPAAQNIPDPIVPANAERTVPALPWHSRVSRVLRGVADKIRTRFQRLQRPQRIAAGTVAALLVLVLVVVVATGGSDDRRSPAATTADTIEVAGRAKSLLDGGKPLEAATLLDRELTTGSRSTRELLAVIERMLALPDSAAALTALDVLGRLEPRPAAMIMAQTTATTSRQVRQRAIEVAERIGLGARVDRVASWSLDLAQAANCDEQRALIAKLAASGNERALPALQAARGTKCIARDASAAIAKIEASKKPQRD